MSANNNVTASPPLTPATIAIVLPPTEVGSEDNVVVGVTLSAGEVRLSVVEEGGVVLRTGLSVVEAIRKC